MKARENDIKEYLDTLLDKLSSERKVRLVSGADFWTTCSEPAIGLNRIMFSDGPAGVRGQKYGDERNPSLSFPSPSAMAATWDEKLMARLAELLAFEAHQKSIHVVLGPTINLHRSPLGGRHFECFSEDPVLTGRMAAAYVAALQSFGVGACPKHYVCNDSETDRFTVDIRVDERTLRELYLLPFEYAVAAGAWLVMSSYNAVNGHTMTENPLLSEPLKAEWGFDGVVISDWMAVRSTEAAGTAGNDLAMPGPSAVWGDRLFEAVRADRVSETTLDDKVGRILRLAGRVGQLDGIAASTAATPQPGSPSRLLREAAASSMVLLRNTGDLLPLDRRHLRRVAVLGASATEMHIQGGGSVTVQPHYAVSPLEGIRSALGDEVDVVHHVGAETNDVLRPVPIDMLTNPFTGESGMHVTFHDVNGAEIHVEDRSTAHLGWLWDELTNVAMIKVQSRLRARRTAVHQLGTLAFGPVRFEAGEAVLIDDLTEQADADGIPSGTRTGEIRLADQEEVDIALSYAVPRPELRTEAAALVGAGLTLLVREVPGQEDESLAAAVTAAREADIAIVVVGTTAMHEREGRDRSTLKLPGRQDDLIRHVAAVNSQTIVVINSGAPIEMPWHTDVSAVLISWFPGQEFGHALADVLLGTREPGGRLPTTWATRDEDVPILDTTPDHGHLVYAEGLHIGYRAWSTLPTPPAYPFGHGLGYTAWNYLTLHVPNQVDPHKPTTVHVQVANTGNRPGREIVQVYLQRSDSSIERPALWLVDFAAVTAAPGEHIDVTMNLEPRAFQHWSTINQQWETEPGMFTVLAGRSAAHLPLRASIAINNDGTGSPMWSSPLCD